MDFDLPITYRTVTLNDLTYGPANAPLSGNEISRISYSETRGEGYREKRSLDDGYDAGRVFLGFRPIEITGKIYGSTLRQFWDNVQKVRRAFTPTLAFANSPGDLGFMPFKFSQQTNDTANWPTGIAPLMMLARPEAQPRIPITVDRLSGVEEYGYSIEYNAMLWCRDPRIYVQDATNEAGSQQDLISGVSGTGNMPNRGDYPCPLNFLLKVAAGGADRWFHFVGLGTDFTVKIPTSSNARGVRVDSTLKTVHYEEAVVTGTPEEVLRMDLITFAAGLTWPKVPTSPTTVYNWTCTTGQPLASGSKIWYSEAFA